VKSDRIVAVAAVLLAAVYLFATEQIPALQIGDPMGAKAIPRLLGVALLISAGLLWLESRLAGKKAAAVEPARAPGIPREWKAVGAAVAWTALYFLVFERLGYAFATSAYLLALMAWFNRGRWMMNVVTAVLFSFGSYLAFTRLFGAPLAPGILPF
jgi:putative tricarboxylic transport membrane protein